MEISAAMVKDLRESTGAGMMDCKKALQEANGDMDKAVDILREKGLGKAAKKADRLASEGLVSIDVADDFSKATIIEVNCETDFVERNEKFVNLVKNTSTHIQNKGIKDADELNSSEIEGVKFEEYLKTKIAVIISANCGKADKTKVATLLRQFCMHAAAMKPQVISYKDLSLDFVEKECVALRAELAKENEELKRLGKPLNHIPEFASRLQLSDEQIKKAEDEIKDELRKENKPEKIWDKIIPGKLSRFIADNTILDQRLTLLSQFFVMDDKKTIEEVIADASKELGDKIEITGYVRYEVGEGLEKKEQDFAAEVAAQIG